MEEREEWERMVYFEDLGIELYVSPYAPEGMVFPLPGSNSKFSTRYTVGPKTYEELKRRWSVEGRDREFLKSCGIAI